MIEPDRVSASRRGGLAVTITRDPLIVLSSPTWCDWCETRSSRSLDALHRCPTCGRSCCRAVAVSPRDVAAAMSARPTTQQRTWDPD
jgi:hypothetical protein